MSGFRPMHRAVDSVSPPKGEPRSIAELLDEAAPKTAAEESAQRAAQAGPRLADLLLEVLKSPSETPPGYQAVRVRVWLEVDLLREARELLRELGRLP